MKKTNQKLFQKLFAVALAGTCAAASAAFMGSTAAEAETETCTDGVEDVSSLTAAGGDLSVIEMPENAYNKIHFYFTTEEYTTIDSMAELNAASQEMTEIAETAEAAAQAVLGVSDDVIAEEEAKAEISMTVQFDSDYFSTEEYLAFSEERETLETIEDVHEFRTRLNAFSKEYHANLVEENLSTLDGWNYNEIESVSYSPFVRMRIDADEVASGSLYALAEEGNVTSISLAYETEAEEEASWNNTLSYINAQTIVSNGTYTGDGVRIGVYEAEGICDVNHTNLKNSNITVRDTSVKTSTHATAVASIIAIMCPDAELFVSDVDDKIMTGIEWFIDQGCDVVNCSFGYYNNKDEDKDGIYEEGVKSYKTCIDGVYDYQVKAAFISVVKSAGNYNDNNADSAYNPSNKISSPGYAYNVITVGGVTVSSGGLVHADDASYYSSIPNVKPNVSALYYVTIPNVGSEGGTSFAAPQVTACVAMMIEQISNYSLYPERILSVITATAQETYDYNNGYRIGNFHTKVGAGVISLEDIINSPGYEFAYNASNASGSELFGITLNLEENDELCFALSWLVIAENSSTSSAIEISRIYLGDYNLYLYDSSGTVLMSSVLTKSNVELIRYTVETAGTYRMSVYQVSPIPLVIDDNLFLCYSVR